MNLNTFMSQLSLQSDSTQLVFLLIGVLVVGLLLVAVSYLVYSATPQGRMDALLEDRAVTTRRNPSTVWALRLAVLALLFGAVWFSADYAGQPEQCARCHGDSVQAATLVNSAHASVDCLECHRRTGFTGPLRTVGMYTRWVYVYAATQEPPEPVSGSVEDGACLSCHRYVLTETTELKGVRVRHSDFLDEGARCRDCHNATAHPEGVQEPTEPKMSDCIVCHDGEQASSACETCHVSDPLQYTVSGKPLPKVNDLDTGNCYGCHNERQSCLWCHGATMPHPAGWSPDEAPAGQPGLHARAGFTDRDSCYRCHYGSNGIFEFASDNCQPCHETPGIMHGGKPWIREHGLQATGQKGGEFSNCYTCHGEGLCLDCHPASYAERYSPRGGADEYRRDMPLPPDYFDY